MEKKLQWKTFSSSWLDYAHLVIAFIFMLYLTHLVGVTPLYTLPFWLRVGAIVVVIIDIVYLLFSLCLKTWAEFYHSPWIAEAFWVVSAVFLLRLSFWSEDNFILAFGDWPFEQAMLLSLTIVTLLFYVVDLVESYHLWKMSQRVLKNLPKKLDFSHLQKNTSV